MIKPVLIWLNSVLLLHAAAQQGQVMEATYRYTGVANLLQPTVKHTVIWKLETDAAGASFYDPLKRRTDSLYAIDKRAAAGAPLAWMAAAGNYRQGTPFQAYTDYAGARMTVLDNLGVYYTYEEKLPLQQWTLHPDTMQVAGRTLHKATTVFRGRHYTAWYATDIPSVAGPWKFHGLPGLIFSIADDQDHHRFECIEISFSRQNHTARPFIEDARPTDYAAFARLRRLRAENPEAFLREVIPGVDISPADVQGKKAMEKATQNGKGYNPLELGD